MGPVGPQDAVALELLGRQINKVKGLAHPDHCLQLLSSLLSILVGDVQWAALPQE